MKQGKIMDFKDVMDRLATVIEKETKIAPYDKNIAKAIGMSPSQYANHKKRNAIPYRNVSDFCAKHSITINWVLYQQSTQKLQENEEEIFKIKMLKQMNVSAGGGAFNDEEDIEYIHIDKYSAKHLGINSVKNIEAINFFGDSMNPTLKENSIIIIDRNQTNLSNSGIFVVNTVSGLFVKRLAINPNGGIDLISDNKNYPVVTMWDEIYIVGKVVGALEKI